MSETIIALVAFFIGWKLRGYLDLILTRLAVRIFASAFGKRVILETLVEGIEKLDAHQPKEGGHG